MLLRDIIKEQVSKERDKYRKGIIKYVNDLYVGLYEKRSDPKFAIEKIVPCSRRSRMGYLYDIEIHYSYTKYLSIHHYLETVIKDIEEMFQVNVTMSGLSFNSYTDWIERIETLNLPTILLNSR